MADAASPEADFSANGVRSFIIRHGGKVSNVAMVGHFMAYLRHADKEVREENRKKFKEFMNEVAVVKKDEKDDKVLVLKKKQKELNYGDFVELPRLVVFKEKENEPPSASAPQGEDSAQPVPPARPSKQLKRSWSKEETMSSLSPVPAVSGPSVSPGEAGYSGPTEQADVVSTQEGERIIDQKRQIKSVRSFADIFDQEVQTQKEEVERLKSPVRTPKRTSAVVTADVEEEQEVAKQEEGTTAKEDEPPPLISPGLRSSGTMVSISSEAGTSCSAETVVHWHQLDPLEHKWMMESAKANLAAMSDLLKQDITLAGKKDFVTGFTALHWGAKHGKKEMIRLVADRGADVNARSQGGYTPLHIAAIHNKESVLQFLIQDYRADINVRDFSGRKARHYLKNGASSYMQQMMTDTPTTSPPRVRLMALADTSPSDRGHHGHHHGHHHSMFSSFRDTIRSIRLWGSADNLDDVDDTQPAKPRKDNMDYLMPPPAALPKVRRHTEMNAPHIQRSEMRKSESDPNIMETTEAMYV